MSACGTKCECRLVPVMAAIELAADAKERRSSRPPMKPILRVALLNALSTALYVTVVGSFLFYAAQMRLGQAKTILVPIAMLMLLVFSAALVGVLIFGRPLLWYLEGRKQDSLLLLAGTLAILFVITAAAFATLVVLIA